MTSNSSPRPTRASIATRTSSVAGPTRKTSHSCEFVRLAEIGDEVVATVQITREDGTRFRNTEIHTFDGDKVVRAEVYFGWDLD